MEQDLRYPVGKFRKLDSPLTPAERATRIAEIAATPANLRAAVKGLDDNSSTRPIAPTAGPSAKLRTTSPTRT